MCKEFILKVLMSVSALVSAIGSMLSNEIVMIWAIGVFLFLAIIFFSGKE